MFEYFPKAERSRSFKISQDYKNLEFSSKFYTRSDSSISFNYHLEIIITSHINSHKKNFKILHDFEILEVLIDSLKF